MAQRFSFRFGHELQHNILARPEGKTDSVSIAFRVRELGLRRQSDEEPLPEDRMGRKYRSPAPAPSAAAAFFRWIGSSMISKVSNHAV